MWWYLSETERERVTAIIGAAGARATDARRWHGCGMELMAATDADLRLTKWPGGDEMLLGRADPHGRYVRWTEAPACAALRVGARRSRRVP